MVLLLQLECRNLSTIQVPLPSLMLQLSYILHLHTFKSPPSNVVILACNFKCISELIKTGILCYIYTNIYHFSCYTFIPNVPGFLKSFLSVEIPLAVLLDRACQLQILLFLMQYFGVDSSFLLTLKTCYFTSFCPMQFLMRNPHLLELFFSYK